MFFYKSRQNIDSNLVVLIMTLNSTNFLTFLTAKLQGLVSLLFCYFHTFIYITILNISSEATKKQQHIHRPSRSH